MIKECFKDIKRIFCIVVDLSCTRGLRHTYVMIIRMFSVWKKSREQFSDRLCHTHTFFDFVAFHSTDRIELCHMAVAADGKLFYFKKN